MASFVVLACVHRQGPPGLTRPAALVAKESSLSRALTRLTHLKDSTIVQFTELSVELESQIGFALVKLVTHGSIFK
eukprot:5819054-Pyramimonas_sp.AAC.1